jgi:hypothetical protein
VFDIFNNIPISAGRDQSSRDHLSLSEDKQVSLNTKLVRSARFGTLNVPPLRPFSSRADEVLAATNWMAIELIRNPKRTEGS